MNESRYTLNHGYFSSPMNQTAPIPSSLPSPFHQPYSGASERTIIGGFVANLTGMMKPNPSVHERTGSQLSIPIVGQMSNNLISGQKIDVLRFSEDNLDVEACNNLVNNKINTKFRRSFSSSNNSK